MRAMRSPRRATWLFDVDGTLIGSIRSDRLRPGVRELLVALAARDVQCILWSAGGGGYAERKAREHGIAHHFAAFYPKLDRDSGARYLLDHLDAEHRPDVFVDDSPEDLPARGRVVAVSQFFGSNRADRALLDLVDRLGDKTSYTFLPPVGTTRETPSYD